MSSRSDPSLSKVQLLSHLHECHCWAAKACRDNAHIVSGIFQSPRPVAQHVHKAHNHVEDFLYFAEELQKQTVHVSTLRQTVIDQIELHDKLRNRIIGLFIALYVPLAFATVSHSGTITDCTLLIWKVILRDEHQRIPRFTGLDQHYFDRISFDDQSYPPLAESIFLQL